MSSSTEAKITELNQHSDLAPNVLGMINMQIWESTINSIKNIWNSNVQSSANFLKLRLKTF